MGGWGGGGSGWVTEVRGVVREGDQLAAFGWLVAGSRGGGRGAGCARKSFFQKTLRLRRGALGRSSAGLGMGQGVASNEVCKAQAEPRTDRRRAREPDPVVAGRGDSDRGRQVRQGHWGLGLRHQGP